MEISLDMLNRLVGKSFKILDGTSVDIYMMFESHPVPFYLLKSATIEHMHQMQAIGLLTLLQAVEPELIDLVFD